MRILAFLLILIAPLRLDAQGQQMGPAIISLESGVVCAPPSVGAREAPGTVAGMMHLIEENPPFVSTENRVPAVIGIGFGIKAQAAASDLEAVTISIRHPPMGDDGVTEQSFLSRVSGSNPSLAFYQFDHDYELLPGLWELSAYHDGELLYSATFKVLPPRFVPELAGVCGFEDLLS